MLMTSAAANAQSDPAGFSTVINVPPSVAPGAVPADTQVNVFFGGAFLGRFNRATDSSEVNLLGGDLGLAFQAEQGSTLNVVDGTVGFDLRAFSGSTVSVSGGAIGNRFLAEAGSVIAISGGQFERGLTLRAGSATTIRGDDFAIDGVPIGGLTSPGDAAPLSLPVGAIFTGVFEDGTPFAFSSLDSDAIADNVVTLRHAPTPTATQGVIIASVDGLPSGVRTGQTLIADSGAVVKSAFNVAPGAALEVTSGGSFQNELEAVDATVRVNGGRIDGRLDLFRNSLLDLGNGVVSSAYLFDGSMADISGGKLSSAYVHDGARLTLSSGSVLNLFARAGSSVDLRGGFTPFIDSQSGSDIQISGSQFRLNGVPVDLSSATQEGVAVNLPSGAQLTGVLESGQPFGFRAVSFNSIADGSIRLMPAAPPAVAPEEITTSIDGPLSIARDGQSVVVDSLSGLLPDAALHNAGVVRVVQGGSVDSGLRVMASKVLVDGGTLNGGFHLFSGAELIVRSGVVANTPANLTGASGGAFKGSRIKVTGGSFGGVFVEQGATGYFATEGSVGPFDIGGDVVVAKGQLGVGIDVLAGGKLHLAGGTLPAADSRSPDFDAAGGSEVHLYGTDFRLSGNSIGTYGATTVITDRGGRTLTGVLMDGSDFSLKLDTQNDPACCILYSTIASNALLTVTTILAGDYNVDGAVDQLDYQAWSAAYGKTIPTPGVGPDGNFDGVVDAADYVVWRDNLGASIDGDSGPNSVPEPACLAFAGLVVYFGAFSRRAG